LVIAFGATGTVELGPSRFFTGSFSGVGEAFVDATASSELSSAGSVNVGPGLPSSADPSISASPKDSFPLASAWAFRFFLGGIGVRALHFYG
jgi:hypothetical protein